MGQESEAGFKQRLERAAPEAGAVGVGMEVDRKLHPANRAIVVFL